MTAVILGIARIAGETAPILFNAGGNKNYNWNPFSGQQDNLPLRIYELIFQPDTTPSESPGESRFVLVLVVLILFVIARLIGSSKPGQRRIPRLLRPQEVHRMTASTRPRPTSATPWLTSRRPPAMRSHPVANKEPHAHRSQGHAHGRPHGRAEDVAWWRLAAVAVIGASVLAQASPASADTSSAPKHRRCRSSATGSGSPTIDGARLPVNPRPTAQGTDHVPPPRPSRLALSSRRRTQRGRARPSPRRRSRRSTSVVQ